MFFFRLKLHAKTFTENTAFYRSYLEGICTILYDTLRPYIIHINHLETLAEICGILRIEMLDEHVQHHGKLFILVDTLL